MNEYKSPYKNLILFWFSGTGNARRIAGHIAEYGKEKGLHVEMHDITKLNQENYPEIKDDTMIGFCTPTHGFNMPPLMLKFIARFRKRKTSNTHVFVLNTRAGMKLYKLFMPGLSGVALYLPALLLRLKGYKVKGYQPMDMPSNWISLHPGIRHKVVMSIDQRCKRISERFAEKILAGKYVFKGWLSLPFDIAIAPIALAYYFIGRFGLAKTFFASTECNHCGLCIKQCPVNAIIELKGINFWSFSCESCMKCMNSCPKRAIEIAHGYTFLVWWLILSVLTGFIFNLIMNLDLMNDQFSDLAKEGIYNTVLIGLTFLIVFIAYHILHFMLRFKWFNQLMVYTSLTRVKFWRRYSLSDHLKAENKTL